MKIERIDKAEKSKPVKKIERIKRREDTSQTDKPKRIQKLKRTGTIERAEEPSYTEKAKRTEKAKYDFSKLKKTKEINRGGWLTVFLGYSTLIMLLNLLLHSLLLLSIGTLLPFIEIDTRTNLNFWFLGLIIIDVFAIVSMIGLVRWKLWGFLGVEGYFVILGIFQILNFDIFGAIQSAMLFFILGYLLSSKMQKFQ